ncbi:LysE family translocator [Kiloniella laminariae]|uniref:LysE family translocator n=1 Tax=Kiloniella laminariae TaxID=454162 RepID=UPI0003A8324C|nr:LysE family translocator [Kiloniella laminariae]
MLQLLPELSLLVPFILAGIALNLTPGVDMAYVLAKTTQQGRNAGFYAALGISLGSMVHVTASALGISALLAASETAFLVLKILGAAYLLYIAFKILTSPPSTSSTEEGEEAQIQPSALKIILEGATTNLLNPKVGLFMLAFLPQFIDAAPENVIWQTLVLGLVFNINGYLIFVILITLTMLAATRIKASTKIRALLRWSTAGILGGMALRLAFTDK